MFHHILGVTPGMRDFADRLRAGGHTVHAPDLYDGRVFDSMEDAVAFVKTFVESGKPVAAICHAPWTLIEADVVRGKRITSWPSLQTDLRNAGAEWLDEQVVTDGNLITSRNPDDLPAFIGALLEAVNHGASSASSTGA